LRLGGLGRRLRLVFLAFHEREAFFAVKDRKLHVLKVDRDVLPADLALARRHT
jgi:hypothetical protein